MIGGVDARMNDAVATAHDRLIREGGDIDAGIDEHMGELLAAFDDKSLADIEWDLITNAERGDGQGHRVGHLPLIKRIKKKLINRGSDDPAEQLPGIILAKFKECLQTRDAETTPEILGALCVTQPAKTTLNVGDHPTLHSAIIEHAHAMFASDGPGSVAAKINLELEGQIKRELLFFKEDVINESCGKLHANLTAKHVDLEASHRCQCETHPDAYERVLGRGFLTGTLVQLRLEAERSVDNLDTTVADALSSLQCDLKSLTNDAFSAQQYVDVCRQQHHHQAPDEPPMLIECATFETSAQQWHRFGSDQMVHLRLKQSGPDMGELTWSRSPHSLPDDVLGKLSVKGMSKFAVALYNNRYFLTLKANGRSIVHLLWPAVGGQVDGALRGRRGGEAAPDLAGRLHPDPDPGEPHRRHRLGADSVQLRLPRQPPESHA